MFQPWGETLFQADRQREREIDMEMSERGKAGQRK